MSTTQLSLENRCFMMSYVGAAEMLQQMFGKVDYCKVKVIPFVFKFYVKSSSIVYIEMKIKEWGRGGSVCCVCRLFMIISVFFFFKNIRIKVKTNDDKKTQNYYPLLVLRIWIRESNYSKFFGYLTANLYPCNSHFTEFNTFVLSCVLSLNAIFFRYKFCRVYMLI